MAFASRRLERSLDDLTLPQFRVLSLLVTSPERAARVAELAAVSRPSLTGILDGLEGRKLIRRHHVSDDRRGVRIDVTAAGRRALARAGEQAAIALDELLGQLDADGRRTALAGMAALGAALRAGHGA